jgi:hypothetical protein
MITGTSPLDEIVVDEAALYDLVDKLLLPAGEAPCERFIAHLQARGFTLSNHGEAWLHPKHWLQDGDDGFEPPGVIGWDDDVGYQPRTDEARVWLAEQRKQSDVRVAERRKNDAEERRILVAEKMGWPWLGHEEHVVRLLRDGMDVAGRMCTQCGAIEVHLYNNGWSNGIDRQLVVDSAPVHPNTASAV